MLYDSDVLFRIRTLAKKSAAHAAYVFMSYPAPKRLKKAIVPSFFYNFLEVFVFLAQFGVLLHIGHGLGLYDQLRYFIEPVLYCF